MPIKEETLIKATIDGKEINVPSNLSVIQALWHACLAQIMNIGCMAGACGSCRVFVRKLNSLEVKAELACQLILEEGMQINFLPNLETYQRRYEIENITNYEHIDEVFRNAFPEAENCRHCGGCDNACPEDIKVEHGVVLATQGEYRLAGDLFMSCVQCNLCETACPESIAPNQLGVFTRRASARVQKTPPNLQQQHQKLRDGILKLEY